MLCRLADQAFEDNSVITIYQKEIVIDRIVTK